MASFRWWGGFGQIDNFIYVEGTVIMRKTRELACTTRELFWRDIKVVARAERVLGRFLKISRRDLTVHPGWGG